MRINRSTLKIKSDMIKDKFRLIREKRSTIRYVMSIMLMMSLALVDNMIYNSTYTVHAESLAETSNKPSNNQSTGEIASIKSSYNQTKSNKQSKLTPAPVKNETLGYIYIGDSRFVGMNKACDISSLENSYVIASVGKGYDFLVKQALPEAENIEKSNEKVDKWIYIISLGVNDLHNVEKYISTYEELVDTKNVCIVSVNPIEYHDTITNSTIEKFNTQIKKIENIEYIDTYSTMMKNGFSTGDGLHYTNKTYTAIFGLINLELKEIYK